MHSCPIHLLLPFSFHGISFHNMILLQIQRHPHCSTLFPYTTLFRSVHRGAKRVLLSVEIEVADKEESVSRSEEHTSELQSREKLVCRLLLEKKNYPLSIRVRLV